MNTISRGIRNAFRNTIRTVSIVLILGLSIGLSLAMIVARASVSDKIESVKSSVGNVITIAPAGVQGFQGGGDPLTSEQIAQVRAVTNVTSVTETLSDRLTTDNTNLVSAIEAGSLGNRNAGNSGIMVAPSGGGSFSIGGNGPNGGSFTTSFTPPVVVTGTNNPSSSSLYGGSAPNLTSGESFDGATDENVAVLGKDLAEKNNLVVGSTFTMYGTEVKVIGIFDTGTTFSNNAVIVPIASLQKLSSQTGNVTSAEATVNSVDNMEVTVTEVKSVLGDAADVTSNQETVTEAVAPLESVKTISTYSLIGALAAGAVIILLTMVMIVRERRREIGVFKAIGATNGKVVFQFMSEAITLTVLAMIAGLIIGSVAAAPVTKVLVNNSTSSSSATQTPGGGPSFSRGGPVGGGTVTVQGGGQTGNFRAFRSLGNNTLANARSVQASVGWSAILFGVFAALFIAVIGSAIPAFLISKVRPAEVMRAE